MMVGEVNLTKTELIAPYLGDSDELHLAFDFESLAVPWEAHAWRSEVWFGTQSITTRMSRAWHARTSSSKSSSVPNTGSTSQ